MSQEVKIWKADWNLRPKTKFIHVEGTVMGMSFADTVEVDRAEPQGINPNILLLNARVVDGQGPMKPQPVPFYFADVTMGDEPWTHVQVECDGESATFPISKNS